MGSVHVKPDAQMDQSPARRARVAMRVPQLGVVHVDGADGLKVVSGLCTAQVKELPVGQACEAFFPDDRGRVLAHAVIAHLPSGVWIVGQLPNPQSLVAHIDRFIFREAATPRDVTDQWSAWLLDSPVAVASCLPADRTAGGAAVSEPCGQTLYQGETLQWLCLPATSPTACLVMMAKTHASLLETALQAAGITPSLDDTDFELSRIENFWPTQGHEISERTLPQELDRDALAISFTKGCYLGQETVARLDALGQVQKKLCVIELAGQVPAATGPALSSDGKEIGQITSVAPQCPLDRQLALAYLRRGHWTAGTPFQWSHGTGCVRARP